jgi:uncharacterized membrane protein
MHRRSQEVKNSASLVDPTEQSRVSWGKYFRAQEFEYVINKRAPLPSPEVLRAYDHAVPGTANRIVRLLEREVEAGIKRADKRELFASITRLVALVGGFILLWCGKNFAGAIAFVLTFADVVGSSVAGKIRKAKAGQKTFEQVTNAVALERHLDLGPNLDKS